MREKHLIPILVILTFLTLSLFAQEDTVTEPTEYTAKVADFNVLIDGKELLTSNPIVTINDKIYIPIEDLEKQLSIEIIRDGKKRLIFSTLIEQIEAVQKESNRADKKVRLEIITNVPFTGYSGFTVKEKIVGVAMTKEYAGKLRIGMTWSEIEKSIGRPIQDIGSGVHIYGYQFPAWESLNFSWDLEDLYSAIGSGLLRENDVKLSAAWSSGGFDLLRTEYTAKIIDFPFIIDGTEIFTSNPIVMLGNDKVHIPIEELAEKLGVKLSFDEKANLLTITTKQDGE